MFSVTHQNHGYRKGNLDDFGLVTTNFATLNYHEGARLLMCQFTQPSLLPQNQVFKDMIGSEICSSEIV